MSDQPSAITFAATIPPPEQPAEPSANDRSDEPVSVLVILNHFDGFVFTQKAMRRHKMLQADCHFFAGLCLNITHPIAIWAETICHHNLGPGFPVLHHFEDGLPPQAGAPANVSQQEEAVSEQPTQSPAVEVHRRSK
ncbi:MAG TPA: hypothetical protein VEU11_16445 [Terriglobales bacterium]|nr:hypothetical protein [Terriglobales bacterium]